MHDGIPEASFAGHGNKKKDAENKAAEEALKWLKNQDAYAVLMPQPADKSAWLNITKSFTENGRLLQKWIKQYYPHLTNSASESTIFVRKSLSQETLQSHEQLSLSSDGYCVSCLGFNPGIKAADLFELGPLVPSRAGPGAESGQAIAVLVPADGSAPSEVLLNVELGLTSQAATCLGLLPGHQGAVGKLQFHGRVGLKTSRLRHPAEYLNAVKAVGSPHVPTDTRIHSRRASHDGGDIDAVCNSNQEYKSSAQFDVQGAELASGLLSPGTQPMELGRTGVEGVGRRPLFAAAATSSTSPAPSQAGGVLNALTDQAGAASLAEVGKEISSDVEIKMRCDAPSSVAEDIGDVEADPGKRRRLSDHAVSEDTLTGRGVNQLHNEKCEQDMGGLGEPENVNLTSMGGVMPTADCSEDAALSLTLVNPVSEPVMYSILPDVHEDGVAWSTVKMNRVASWIVGQPVYGDVLLTRSRASMDKYGKALIRWHDYNLDDLWCTASAPFPSMMFARQLLQPQVALLPATYSQRLAARAVEIREMSPSRVASPTASNEKWPVFEVMGDVSILSEDIHEGGVVCTASAPSAMSGQVFTSSSEPCLDLELAEQQSSLRLLHLLEEEDARKLRDFTAFEILRDNQSLRGTQTGIVNITKKGNVSLPSSQPKSGNLVKVKYVISMKSSSLTVGNEISFQEMMPNQDVNDSETGPVQDTVIVEGTVSFLFGCFSVIPELERAVACIHVGGETQTEFMMALEGSSDPLHAFKRLPAQLTVQLLEVKQVGQGTGGGAGPNLFSPPLGLQRLRLVVGLVRDARPETFVDIGCGEGKLIEQFVTTLQDSQVCVSEMELDDSAANEQHTGEKVGISLHEKCGGSVEGRKLSHVFGLDVSEGGLKGAVKRLSKLPPGMIVQLQDNVVENYIQVAISPSGLQEVPLTTHGQPQVASQPVSISEGRGGVVTLGSDAQSAIKDLSGDAAETSTSSPSKVKLFLGSAFTQALQEPAAWGDLHGCDVATMVEVIEHLDPPLLEMVAPCLLGGLRPGMLVVTTPNWEYNQVMREAEKVQIAVGSGSKVGQYSWPGPPGRDGLALRCNDHRFEWTRCEFRSWAEDSARKYGYVVRFLDLGHCIEEPAVLQTMAKDEGVGAAVQIAVFTRCA
ncbi:hypothetical protein CEUSTIGMA_g11654.t1 [Chlamydomonas eustigma]|uniref:Small RNA 2'-O-methyltransferase n=1 Tax=Chlamydomonas eustigma TaxID=1157962 RepID=A0A250XMA0_9CHLO|nr:hypothetical protein CEUSTIGMA_g11654.t1 [Chlamydomonas eustigma]|eukprot:GAX84231.1 hypothetical protein CEUSTIGMA_g11654.t1 [Chlamydomonas eustigma]